MYIETINAPTKRTWCYNQNSQLGFSRLLQGISYSNQRASSEFDVFLCMEDANNITLCLLLNYRLSKHMINL